MDKIYDIVSCDVETITDNLEHGTKIVSHSELIDLDYEHSGHTGFVSTAQLQQHIEAVNPHNITCETIGAISIADMELHMNAENPHHITCEMIGAAPAVIPEDIPEIPAVSVEEAKTGYIYVDNSGVQNKISVNTIKDMNTKIISADSDADERIQTLSKDDFVYIKK